jgi:hypothetical protein
LKTIALIDPFTEGHHLAFMRLFAKTLLDLNYQVIILYPQPNKVKEWLLINCPNQISNCYFVDYQVVKTNKKKYWGIFAEAHQIFKLWQQLGLLLKKKEKELKIKIDFAFFAWLDSYLANFLHPYIVNIFFPFLWSGLYFHPRHLRINYDKLKLKPSFSDIDIILSSKKCRNITVHDEGIIKNFNQRLNKPVILFPEIADNTPPDENYAPAIEIKTRAKGRIVVGLPGILDKLKGLIHFIRMIKLVSPEDYFFVLAGPLNISAYDQSIQDEINLFIQSTPENCFIYLNYIEEGAKFNAVFDTLDILYLVYDNFASSSNRLTKAANFNKKVLAQNRYCIGEDVAKYQLGITVQEGDVQGYAVALESLKSEINEGKFPKDLYQAYKELHSVEILKARFKEVIGDLK